MKDPKLSDKTPSNQGDGKTEGKAFTKDIAPVLSSWEYEPGSINVRKVHGLDGNPKLQMRLDLGLLQMEMSGRPDGNRPHGHESLLEYYQQKLAKHTDESGTDSGFELTSEQCQHLREEAMMYYHRYLSLFVLEEFAGVVRDTDRNMRVMDFCGKYAAGEQDRLMLEQYRPYLTMMNAKARASIHLEHKRYREAVKALKDGVKLIRQFHEKYGQEEAFERSSEARVLKRFAKEIAKKLPVDPVQRLQRRLDRAVKEERYEDAAKLRDELGISRPRKGDTVGAEKAGPEAA